MSFISNQLISWHQNHGRHDLPWQKTKNPYKIWVSEIMLQQTQVNTVINYYQKFLKKFPTIQSLAQANEEMVMELWSGLGYYARARNLHNCAIIITEKFYGEFPITIDELITLPGIGRSTAGAICVFSFGQKHPILDGNVKRVFSRFFGIKGWPNTPAIEKKLWELVESTLPKTNIEIYTQALMDLGATICKRKNVQCELCPLKKFCKSYLNQWVDNIPTPKPKKIIPTKIIHSLVIENNKKILFFKKPRKGIWGGLWSFPEFIDPPIIEIWLKNNLKVQKYKLLTQGIHTATFTHYKLKIHYQYILLKSSKITALPNNFRWLMKDEIQNRALPTPTKQMIKNLA